MAKFKLVVERLFEVADEDLLAVYETTDLQECARIEGTNPLDALLDSELLPYLEQRYWVEPVDE